MKQINFTSTVSIEVVKKYKAMGYIITFTFIKPSVIN